MPEKTPIKNVRLAFACDKSWDKMQPCAEGKFCVSCQTTVIDFREKSQEDLLAALEKEDIVCGRFSASQLTTVSQPPSFSFRRVAASTFLALGLTSLGNELKAQTVPPREFPKAQTGREDFVGIVLEKMPEYKHGGQAGMFKFIEKHLAQVSKANVEGVVITHFTIDTTGAVREPQILKGLSKEIDLELLRVVQLLEFIPGMQGERKVSVKYTVPVRLGPEKRKKK